MQNIVDTLTERAYETVVRTRRSEILQVDRIDTYKHQVDRRSSSPSQNLICFVAEVEIVNNFNTLADIDGIC